MAINDRLNELIDTLGLNMRAFASEAGLDYTTVFNVVSPSGRRSKPNADFLDKIKKEYPHVDLNWLVSGVDSMFIEKNTTHTLEEPHVPYGNEQDNLAAMIEKLSRDVSEMRKELDELRK